VIGNGDARWVVVYARDRDVAGDVHACGQGVLEGAAMAFDQRAPCRLAGEVVGQRQCFVLIQVLGGELLAGQVAELDHVVVEDREPADALAD